jgi:hypothetical protein
MSVVQKAIAVAWGTGSTFTFTGSALLKVNPLRAGLQRNAQMVEFPDKNGEAIGLAFFNQTDEIDFTVYPSDDTLAHAVTAGGAIGLNVGDKLVVVNADDTDLAGNKIVTKVSKTRKVDGYVEFDISVKKWPTDLSTTIAA